MASAQTFRRAWHKGQRCLIVAQSYCEPYWPPQAARSIRWRFHRSDGAPWALAGLWDVWTDPLSGELVPSYTLITQNCDGHPLLSLMHKPDPKLPADRQDKRCPVPIEHSDWDTWLHGDIARAQALIKVPQLELFKHGPADPAVSCQLPL